jgi:hypothetical protein
VRKGAVWVARRAIFQHVPRAAAAIAAKSFGTDTEDQMTAAIVTVGLTMAMNSFGLAQDVGAPHVHAHRARHLYILPPGPGDGWGFPNGAPDGYGWVSYGWYLPLGGDRTAEYFFPRYFAAPPDQMFFPTYYNCFETRGQRYIPFVGAGGDHPAGCLPLGPSDLPVTSRDAQPDTGPVTTVPRLNGRIEAPAAPAGGSGLTP